MRKGKVAKAKVVKYQVARQQYRDQEARIFFVLQDSGT